MFVGQISMFLEHMVCHVGKVAAVSHGMLLSMKQFFMFWCLGVYHVQWCGGLATESWSRPETVGLVNF